MDDSHTTESHVDLVVFEFGDDPTAVSQVIGVQPTQAWIRGEPMPGHPTATRTFSTWRLHSGLPTSAAFEDQITALLDKLESVAGGVRDAVQRFQVGVQVAVYTTEPNPGFNVASQVARRLSALELDLDFDLYPRCGESDVE